MKSLILIICLLFGISCKTNDFIGTALCLIRNKSVQEETLKIMNQILQKDYGNLFQALVKAYTTVKEVLKNECLKEDDDDVVLQKRVCDERYYTCMDICNKKKTREEWLECLRPCDNYCKNVKTEIIIIDKDGNRVKVN